MILGELGINGFTWKEIDQKSDIPDEILENETNLLLIHGTVSSVENSFEDLLTNPNFKTYVQTKYKNYVFGFNHSTIKSGIEKNSKQP